MEKSKVSIQFLLTFRQSGDVLFFLYARRFRGYTATNVGLDLVSQIQKERCKNVFESFGFSEFFFQNFETSEIEYLHLQMFFFFHD